MRRPSADRAAWMVVGAVAGVLNVNFVLDLASDRPAPWSTSVVSDLAVAGRPHWWVYRLADACSALLVLALAARLARRSRRLAGCATGLFALSTMVAAAVPISCAASIVPGCPEAVSQDVAHDLVSTVGTAAAVLAMAVLARTGTTSPTRQAHAAAFAVCGLLGLAMLVAEVRGVPGWFGAAQRVQVVAVSLWFVAVGREVDLLPLEVAPR